MSTAAVDARARELRLCATRRWLVKDELVFLLLHHRQQTAVPCYHALQPRPQSGALMFYDVNDVPDFKKDGWRWQKRKDNSGRVREDRAKLVINREVIILGTYVHSADVPTFHRRNYYLRDSHQHVMLVHYFDEVNKTDPAMGALLPARPLPLVSAPTAVLTSSTKSAKRALSSSHNVPQSELQHLPPPPMKLDPLESTSVSMDVIMRDCFPIEYSTQMIPPAGATNGVHQTPSDVGMFEDQAPLGGFDVQEVDTEALFSDLTNLLSPVSTSSHDAVPGGATTPTPLVPISDFSPDWDFISGGAKLLLCLASPLVLPPVVSQAASEGGGLYVQFGVSARVPAERLSDTVIRCSAPPSAAPGPVDLFVCYSASSAGSECMQLSTVGRFQYKSVVASPSLPVSDGSLSVEVNSLTQLSNAGKRGRSPVTTNARRPLHRRDSSSSSGPRSSDGRRWSNPDINLSIFADTELDERQCKIRVVERLTEFQDAIRINSTSTPRDSFSTNADDSASGASALSGLHTDSTNDVTGTSSVGSTDEEGAPIAWDDGTIEQLSDQDLESLSEQLIEDVVRKLVTIAHTSEELLDELNSLDETGLSLLHYVSFYNYSHLIPLLLSHGAQVNQQSTQGHTALHLAAGCGHEDVVQELVQAGADVFLLDFDGLVAADRAEKSGHVEVAQQLRNLMGESWSPSVVDASIEAEIASNDLWAPTRMAMEIDDATAGSRSDDDFHSISSSQERLGGASEGTSVEGDVDGIGAASSSRSAAYAGDNQEHNRKLLLGAFSTMSLHDKCALSLSISRDLSSSASTTAVTSKRRGSSISEDSVAAYMMTGSSSASSPSKGTDVLTGSAVTSVTGGESESICDSDVKSVIADDEENMNRLEAAMELMGPEELQSLEEEARVIQHNVRAWLLRRNCRNMRETTKRLHEAAKSIEDQQKQHQERLQKEGEAERELLSRREMSERERAAVTVQAAARSMLARKSFLQTRNVTIKVQAATRGVLCRKNFARMKTHALASLVIQRNVREWLSKQPGGAGKSIDDPFGSATASPLQTVDERSDRDDDRDAESDAALVRELTAALGSSPYAS